MRGTSHEAGVWYLRHAPREDVTYSESMVQKRGCPRGRPVESPWMKRKREDLQVLHLDPNYLISETWH